MYAFRKKLCVFNCFKNNLRARVIVYSSESKGVPKSWRGYRKRSGDSNVILALSPTTCVHSLQGALLRLGLRLGVQLGLRHGLWDFTDKNSIWAHIMFVWRQPVISSYSSFRSTDDFKVTITIRINSIL